MTPHTPDERTLKTVYTHVARAMCRAYNRQPVDVACHECAERGDCAHLVEAVMLVYGKEGEGMV